MHGIKDFATGLHRLTETDSRAVSRGAGKAKPISHRAHRGHREGKNVPASPGRAKAKKLFRQASSFENKINCTVQRSRDLQDELDWLLRKRARSRRAQRRRERQTLLSADFADYGDLPAVPGRA
jgi:hypothetical protein